MHAVKRDFEEDYIEGAASMDGLTRHRHKTHSQTELVKKTISWSAEPTCYSLQITLVKVQWGHTNMRQQFITSTYTDSFFDSV